MVRPAFRTIKLFSLHSTPTSTHRPFATQNRYEYHGYKLNAAIVAAIIRTVVLVHANG